MTLRTKIVGADTGVALLEPDGVGRHTERVPGQEPSHVLFLIDQLCDLGGGERALLTIVKHLPEYGFTCSVVTFRLNREIEAFRNIHGLEILPLERTYDWNAMKMALRLRRLVQAHERTIVHTFFETSDLWGGAIARLSGCHALVSSRRDLGIFRTGKHNLAYRLLSRRMDRILTVSDAVRSFSIQQDRVAAERVTTIYNGVDLGNVAAADPAAALAKLNGTASECSHLIVAVGNVRWLKGLDILVRAAAAVCQEFPRALFVVVGKNLEPDYFHQLESTIRALDLGNNVKFAGDSDDVFSFLKAADVFCLPSRTEGFSNALVEAMACGLPCVATTVGGNAEALGEDGHAGFLIRPEDPGAMAACILKLLRNPELARTMGQAAQQRVNVKFSVEVMMQQLAAVYRTLAAR